MQRFIDTIVETVYKKFPENPENAMIVLPSRRAGVFLKEALAKKYKKVFVAPKIFSIEDFISEISELEIIDKLSIFFEMYDEYKKLPEIEVQSFDEFLNWSSTLLSDFNDIDAYLQNPETVFNYITDVQAIEVWSPAPLEPGEFQKKYMHFWKSLQPLYFQLKKRLLDKKLAYQGLAFREVAENIQEKFRKYCENNHIEYQIVFAGLNALTHAEKKIIETLISDKKAITIWNADQYIINQNHQEAGHFLRQHLKNEKLNDKETVLKIQNLLQTQAKKINIAGIPQQNAQGKLCGEIIAQIIKDRTNKEEKLTDTAIVLADEGLLIPVLQSLPDLNDKINISLGYAIQNTGIYNFFEKLLLLQINRSKFYFSQDKKSIYFKDVLSILENGFFLNLYTPESREKIDTLTKYIKTKNYIFINVNEMMEIIGGDNQDIFSSNVQDNLEMVFSDMENDADKMLEMMFYLINRYSEKKEFLKANLNEAQLSGVYLVLKKLKNLYQNFDVPKDLKLFYYIFNQIIAKESIDFIGEPLSGLQIMGMLETRALDFKNIILVSSNENFLPQASKQNTFIPVELKKHFNLPTYRDKDAIFAYHFYSVLRACENITFIYNTDEEDRNSGEKSRFLLQIENELKSTNANVEIKYSDYSFPNKAKHERLEIDNSEKVVQLIKTKLRKGISPTSMSAFLRCPLDFFYKSILGLRETEDVDEVIAANNFGTAVHDTIELLYQPFVGKTISTDAVSDFKKIYNDILMEQLYKVYPKKKLLKYGRNKLEIKIAQEMLENYFNAESKRIRQINNMGHDLKILQLESFLRRNINVNGENFTLSGKADRIDKFGDTLRIVDYKTGKMDEKDLNIKNINDIMKIEKAKALQLCFYALLGMRADFYQSEDKISAEICGLKYMNEDHFKLNFGTSKNKEVIENVAKHEKEIEEIFKNIIQQMIDPNTIFKHKEQMPNYCNFCSA